MRKTKAQIPGTGDPNDELAAAAQAALAKAKEAAGAQMTSEVEWNSRGTHVVKGNQYPNDVWVYGPAQIELMASAYHKLVMLGDTGGSEIRHVTKVRVGRVKGSKSILIRPTDDSDPDGLELKKVGGDWWVNAISILGPAKLTVPTGYSERFTITEASAEVSAVPALQINMGKPIVRRVVSRKKATQAADGTAASGSAKAASTDAATAEVKKTEE